MGLERALERGRADAGGAVVSAEASALARDGHATLGGKNAAQLGRISPARTPRDIGVERMLIIDRVRGEVRDGRIASLPSLLAPNDLLIVNDAATVPASLHGQTDAGAPIELRLASLSSGARGVPATARAIATAVLFGEGSHRDDTDTRPAPPRVRAGARLLFAEDLRAEVVRVHALSPRLLDVRFDRAHDALLAALYRVARPIQYSYVERALPLREVQTAFASRPWAVEMPSAARPLGLGAILALKGRGVRIACLTHAAGLSATGDPALDRALPLPERYALPEPTTAAVAETRARGGRVVAVGTTVVRALEGNAAAHGGALVAGEHATDLRIDRAHVLRVVDALLTNVHAPGESHHDLMRAFAAPTLLDRAHALALARGYLSHELGDATLIL